MSDQISTTDTAASAPSPQNRDSQPNGLKEILSTWWNNRRANVLSLRFDTCSKRGFVNEIIASVLFLYSIAFAMKGLHSLSFATAFVQTVSGSYGPMAGWINSTWWVFSVMVVTIVGFMLVRLYSSYSVFDNDDKECQSWIAPLSAFGRRAEIAVRIAVVVYLGWQVHRAYGESDRLTPLFLNYLVSLQSPDQICETMAQHFAGVDCVLEHKTIFRVAASEIFRIYQVLFVMVELLILSLLWDAIIISFRRQGADARPWKIWRERFLVAHLVSLAVFLLSIAVLGQIVVGNWGPILVLSSITIVLVVYWLGSSTDIVLKWGFFCVRRLRFYFSGSSSPCGS
ncbi:MAG: hypothetical protein ACJ8ER_12815 [Allosphingosinicella sp.]